MKTSRRTLATITAGAVLAAGAYLYWDRQHSDSPPPNPGTAKSAAELGGMQALITAAKKEGSLNVIALAPTMANYGAIIDTFQIKYGIKVNSTNPYGSSQDEIDAVTQLKGTDHAPDVLDINTAAALTNAKLFARYQVLTWNDIPDEHKEPTGLFANDYGGYMSIGYDSAKVPAPRTVTDLLNPAYRNKIALTGDPTVMTSALNAVIMAAVATGGSPDDISKGVTFFTQLKQTGNFTPTPASTATIQDGTTPVVLDWDYINANTAPDTATWKVIIPPNAAIGGYYTQAINADAPHPAAARLWEEFLSSDEGQNLYLKGHTRPVRIDAMTKAGTIDTTTAATLPTINTTPVIPTQQQATKARNYLTTTWPKTMS